MGRVNHEELLSFIGAAQRLGVTVAEVRELVSNKKLKEIEKGKVSKNAVYKLSGLVSEGSQTKTVKDKKPKEVTQKKATSKKEMSKVRSAKAGPVPEATIINEDELEEPKKETVPFDLDLIDEVAEDLHEECEREELPFTREEIRDALDVAFLRGKLSVYESMSKFERKVSV